MNKEGFSNADWILDLVVSLAVGLFGNLVIWSGLAFILGLTLVIIMAAWGQLKRPNIVWSALAKLNFIYLPMVFTIIGFSLASVYTVHNGIDSLIQSSSNEIKSSAKSYLPKFQQEIGSFYESYDLEGKDLKSLLKDMQFSNTKTSSNENSDSEIYADLVITLEVLTLNSIAELVLPGGSGKNLEDKINLLRTTTVDSIDFSLLEEPFKKSSRAYFLGWYFSAFWIMAPFIAVSLAEYLIYLLAYKLPRTRKAQSD